MGNQGIFDGRRRVRTKVWSVFFALLVSTVSFGLAVVRVDARNVVPEAHAFAQGGENRGGDAEQAHPAASANESGTKSRNTDEFRLSRERYEQAVAYSRAGYTLYFISVVWGIAVLVILLKTRAVARWRDVAEKVSGNWIVQGLIFVPGLSLALGVADLPISMYWHRLSLRYQQSVQR